MHTVPVKDILIRVYDVRPNGQKAKWKRPKNKGLTDERPNGKNAKWTEGQKDIRPKNDNHAKGRNVKAPMDQKPNEMYSRVCRSSIEC